MKFQNILCTKYAIIYTYTKCSHKSENNISLRIYPPPENFAFSPNPDLFYTIHYPQQVYVIIPSTHFILQKTTPVKHGYYFILRHIYLRPEISRFYPNPDPFHPSFVIHDAQPPFNVRNFSPLKNDPLQKNENPSGRKKKRRKKACDLSPGPEEKHP